MDQTKTEKRGGKRPNSGPKKKNVERVRISFVVLKDQAEELKKQIKELIKNERRVHTVLWYPTAHTE